MRARSAACSDIAAYCPLAPLALAADAQRKGLPTAMPDPTPTLRLLPPQPAGDPHWLAVLAGRLPDAWPAGCLAACVRALAC